MEILNLNRQKKARDKIIVALDDMDENQIHHFLSEIATDLKYVKIGMEVFYRYGRPFLQEICQQYNVKIFLDLKLHDIPQTVAKSIRSLANLPIEFLTIHLSGGRNMVKLAREAAASFLPQTKILGVTYLTSLAEEDFRELWQFSPPADIAAGLTRLVQMAGQEKIHGLILSAQEQELALAREHAPHLLKICPGIRFTSDQWGDQKRVATPQDALKRGADYLVIGRSLTQESAQGFAQKWQEIEQIPPC